MKKIVIVLIAFLSLNAFSAQDESRFWFGTFSNTQLSQRFSFWVEAQLRYDLDDGQTNQFLYRTGLLQKKSETTSYGYLYGFITNNVINEHRLAFQHVQKYGSFSNYNLSHRLRLEHRMFENIDESINRFRYLLRAQQESKSKLGLVVWDELFVNLQESDLSGDTYFDRNRFFIGFSKKHHNARMEFGYLNQFVPRDNQDLSEHVLVLYIFI